MASSNSAAFGTNATSLNFRNSMTANPPRAEREYTRDARPKPTAKAAALPDWDRFWSDLPISSPHEERDDARS
jgi:hypothetical protein